MNKIKLLLLAAALFGIAPGAFGADETNKPLFSWNLLQSGSWEEFSRDSGTLHNRGEFKVTFLPIDLTLRGELLDRRQLMINRETPLGDPEKALTHILGGFYHKQTGSRLLYGVLDEWGLSARLRNPWIRSAPFAENHKPLIADLKTSASSAKEDELYLYLSSPMLSFSPDLKLRGFLTAQMEVTGDEYPASSPPAIGGGIDFKLPKKNNLLIESFITGAALEQSKSGSWFSDPPRLPQRNFRLYSIGALFYNHLLAVSSDFAISETFSWGTDIYCNLGLSLYLPAPWQQAAFNSGKNTRGGKSRPLTVSIAADGAGKRFVYRDGANHGEGFRTAAKVELKSSRNGLLRFNTTLRGQQPGEPFNRSNTGIYYRLPYPATKVAANQSINPVRLTRISVSADRNAVNPQKTADGLSANISLSLNLTKTGIKTPFGINLSGSIKGEGACEDIPAPFPLPYDSRILESYTLNGEITWSPTINNAACQMKTKVGYTKNSKNDKIWTVSISSAARFKYGRISLKANSTDFPQKWNWTVSWRAEK